MISKLTQLRNECNVLYDELTDITVGVEEAECEIRKAEGHLLRAKELMNGEGIPGL
jgi:hypothetical protein